MRDSQASAPNSAPSARPFRLHGRVAIITGASRGLGLAIARVFAAAGAAQLLIARDPARLDAGAQEVAAMADGSGTGSRFGPAVVALAGDVAQPGFAERAVGNALEQLGRLDILVNNAGIGSSGPIEGVDDARWEEVLDVDLTGPFRFCRAAAPHLTAQRWGRIVNIASISGQTGGARASVAYAAAKAGLVGLTKSLARDLGTYNVTANAIAPGQIATDMGQLPDEQRRALESRIPLGRLGTPQDIAYAALFLASEEAGYITGHTLDVNGGILFR